MQAPSAPSSGDKLDLATVNGALLHIDVKEQKKGVETSFGPADPILADVAVLDGEKKGEQYDDVLIFPRLLINQLSQVLEGSDRVVVGRLGKGVAKPGKSAPWLLQTPTEADLDTARKYEAYAAAQKQKQDEPF